MDVPTDTSVSTRSDPVTTPTERSIWDRITSRQIEEGASWSMYNIDVVEEEADGWQPEEAEDAVWRCKTPTHNTRRCHGCRRRAAA